MADIDHRRGNLGYWNRDAASSFPDRLAILDWGDGQERRLTHGELDAALDRVAAALAKRLRVGARIAIAVGNRAEFVTLFFGAMRAGLVAVPLNLRQGRSHLEHALRDSRCEALVLEPTESQLLTDLARNLDLPVRISLGAELPEWDGYEDVIESAPQQFYPPPLPANHPALQPYTSGSTGLPKGVVLSHEGQVWWSNAYRAIYQPKPDELSLVAPPLYHKNAMAGVVKSKLAGGAGMVLMRSFDPRQFLMNLSKYQCTHATGVPTMYSLALREAELLTSLDFSSLRSLTVGSAPVHPELYRAMEKAFGCSIQESYGLTEGGPVTFGPPADGRTAPIGSCGVLWPGCEAKLVNADGQEGSRGELLVRNPGLLARYHDLPAVTSARLREGWLSTGDLFERDSEGFWYFRGRTDDMFVCGGENIFPKEVEDVLLRHPAVGEVCVVPARHPHKGEAPVALVVLRPGAKADEAGLKQFALESGPAFAHPRRLIVVEALPLNGAGKVDRGAVTRMLRDILSESETTGGQGVVQ